MFMKPHDDGIRGFLGVGQARALHVVEVFQCAGRRDAGRLFGVTHHLAYAGKILSPADISVLEIQPLGRDEAEVERYRRESLGRPGRRPGARKAAES